MGSEGLGPPAAVVGDLGEGIASLEEVASGSAAERVEGEFMSGGVVGKGGVGNAELLGAEERLGG